MSRSRPSSRLGQRRPARRSLRTLAAIAFLIAGFVGTAGASQVYYSPNDDGVPAGGQPSIPQGGVEPVYLYIDGGAASSAGGTACDSGSGDEVCGYTLTLTGSNGLTLASFTPDGAANTLHDLTALEFRINGLDTASPTPGPKRIGMLQVNTASGGSLELSSGEVVGADLSSEDLASGEIVMVPEPAGMLQLGGGLTLLMLLVRRRRAR